MVTFSADARSHLERYLKQVKAALQSHPSVDATEVERDVLGHIDAELTGEPEPVSASSLRGVLDRLGAPDTWVPAEEKPASRRALDTALACVTLVLFAAGVILFLGGPVYWPLEPVMMMASFLLARATLELMAEHDEVPGTRRWLIYPPLVVWYGVFALALFAWPLVPVIIPLEEPVVRDRVAAFLPEPYWMAVVLLAALALGVWWTVLGVLLSRFHRLVPKMFSPFADGFGGRQARRLSLAGALLAAAAGATVLALFTR